MRQALRLLGLSLLLASGNSALAQQASPGYSWKLGVSLAGVSYPAYRGSSVHDNLVLPVPALSFTSPRIKLDRKGARLELLNLPGVRFRLSASGSLPVNSDDVPLRQDMPDLDPSIELGPAAVIDLPCPPPWYCKQETLLRGVIASDLKSIHGIGWTLQPRLTVGFVHNSKRRPGQHRARLTLGPLWASRQYHDYFYSVDAQYATAQRPAYTARSGFSGWRSSFSYNYQRGRLGGALYVAFDDIGGSQFANSPLVETDHYLMAGFYLRWYLWSSDGFADD